MPSRVIWNLSYPSRTDDQQVRLRHHYEVLRNDSHVASVSVTERAEVPFVTVMRVEFADGYDRPDSQELRFADSLYANLNAFIERDIQMTDDNSDAAFEALQAQLRARATGISAVQAIDQLTQLFTAIRLPDISSVFEALGHTLGDIGRALPAPPPLPARPVPPPPKPPERPTAWERILEDPED